MSVAIRSCRLLLNSFPTDFWLRSFICSMWTCEGMQSKYSHWKTSLPTSGLQNIPACESLERIWNSLIQSISHWSLIKRENIFSMDWFHDMQTFHNWQRNYHTMIRSKLFLEQPTKRALKLATAKDLSKGNDRVDRPKQPSKELNKSSEAR